MGSHGTTVHEPRCNQTGIRPSLSSSLDDGTQHGSEERYHYKSWLHRACKSGPSPSGHGPERSGPPYAGRQHSQPTLMTFITGSSRYICGSPVVRQRKYLCNGAFFGCRANNRTRRALGWGTHGWAYQHGRNIRYTVLLYSFWTIELQI